MSQADNVHWVETSKDIEELYHSIAGSKRTYEARVGNALTGTTQVRSTFPEIASAFSMAFPNTGHDRAQRRFYHIEETPIGLNAQSDMALSQTQKPAAALYNPETKDVLVLEKAGFNYGFVNAMVLGFLSKLYMETAMGFYAHAASLSLNGVGILIAGDHKAGKSTLISKILSIAEEADDLDLGIVSDDWILLSFNGDMLEASRLSEEFRIDKKTIMNPHFGVSRSFNALTTSDIEDSTAKIQIPLQDICLRMQLNNLQAIRQDKLVILDPTQESYIKIVDPERALTILSASSANVPPLNAQEYEHFRAFWMAQFDTHETFTVNNRHPSSTLKKVADTVITLSRR